MGKAEAYTVIERIKMLEKIINNRLATELPITNLQKEITSLKNTCEGVTLRKYYYSRE